MLVRFHIQNFYSFGEMREFNMLAAPKQGRLKHHEQAHNGIKLMKMAAIYGANGAGKSNLVKGLALLQGIVQREEVSPGLKDKAFKFFTPDDNKSQVLGIEFIQKGQPFYYAMQLRNGVIESEELYLSGLKSKKDQLVFERKTVEGKTTYRFLDAFENDKESQVLKSVIEKNLAKPSKPSLKLLAELDNPFLKDVDVALGWFIETLIVIAPHAHPRAIPHRIDTDLRYLHFANEIMRSSDTGVSGLQPLKQSVSNIPGDKPKELQSIMQLVEENPGQPFSVQIPRLGQVVFIKEGDEIVVKTLGLKHEVRNGMSHVFGSKEVSDGTLRLAEFTYAFYDLLNPEKVFVIDEIERSIHALMIKELLKKFADDPEPSGQLIFTTHESNLLDQDILRKDEIWFVEKDKDGSSHMYPLSNYEVHSTIDIQKGYLAGRFGGIPFLGNLIDLNWHKHDSTGPEQV